MPTEPPRPAPQRPDVPEAALRGLDLDAFCREAPVWRFGPGRAEVVGCDVRVNLRGLAARLGLPHLLAAGNAARVGAALAQRLLKSYLRPPAGVRYRHFLHVPSALLTLPETWTLLEDLPATSRGMLALTLGISPARRRDLGVVADRLAEIGVCVCLSGVDFATVPLSRLPAAVSWLSGPVTHSLDPLQAEGVLAAVAPAQAIAEPGEDDAALQVAIESGFRHAVGPAADAAARRPQATGLRRPALAGQFTAWP